MWLTYEWLYEGASVPNHLVFVRRDFNRMRDLFVPFYFAPFVRAWKFLIVLWNIIRFSRPLGFKEQEIAYLNGCLNEREWWFKERISIEDVAFKSGWVAGIKDAESQLLRPREK